MKADIYKCACGYGWDKSKVVRHHFCPNCGRAVDSTELEPCTDAISRQAVIDAIITLWADKPFGNPALTEIKECVERVPSANPQRTGHWIIPEDIMWENPKCAECGFESADHDNYCPHCGIRMVEPQERSGEE